MNVAVESPSLRARVYEQRRRIKYEELKKLSYQFSLGPIPDFTADTDNSQNHMEVRRENSASSSTNTAAITATSSLMSTTAVSATTSESAHPNTTRISPTQSRRRGFSKKLFGVFSSRSGSMSSALPPSTQPTNNDLTPSSPQSSGNRDAARSISRPNYRPNTNNANEGLTRKRSLVNETFPLCLICIHSITIDLFRKVMLLLPFHRVRIIRMFLQQSLFKYQPLQHHQHLYYY